MTVQPAAEDFDTVLRDGARRALAGLAMTPDVDGIDAATVARVWAVAMDLGWPLLRLPEDAGGLGGTLAQAVLLGEEIGRAVAPGPFAATLALAPAVAAASDDPAFRFALYQAIADGGRIVWGRADHDAVQMVHDIVGATHALVMEPDGAVALLDLADPIIALAQPLDPMSAIGTIFHDRAAPAATARLNIRDDDRLFGPYRVMLAAECVGLADRGVALALDHVRQRRQFGVEIGSFQAIKHRLADMTIRAEDARALVADAARAWDSERPDCLTAIEAALAAAAEAALRNAGDAIQLHGALGVCWEHPCHLVYKRARRLIALAADPAAARRRLADRLMGD